MSAERLGVSCTYLVRKNRAGVKGPREECGGDVVALYCSDGPDAYGNTSHPRCARHDTEAAKAYVASHDGWSRVEVAE